MAAFRRDPSGVPGVIISLMGLLRRRVARSLIREISRPYGPYGKRHPSRFPSTRAPGGRREATPSALPALLLERAHDFELADGSLGCGAQFASEIARMAPVQLKPVGQDVGGGRRQLVGLEIRAGQVGRSGWPSAAAQRARVSPAAA